MRGRALSLAALAFLVGLSGTIAAGPDVAQAQQLDAGKPPGQIFASTCSVCHRSPRGLVKNVSPGALPGFLRQHYTTGSDMAGIMAAYVLGNGGTERVAEPPPAAKREPKQRAKNNDGEVAPREQAKEQSKAAKQKAAKKGPADAAKQDAAKGPAEAAKEEIAKQPEPAKSDPVEAAKPAPAAAEASKSEPAKSEPAKSEPAKSESAGTETPVAPESKPAAVAAPSQPPAAPRQPTSLLTLPGFPPPVTEPEPTPTATTPAASESAKPSAPASPAAEAPAAAPAAEAPKAETPKVEAAKPADAAPGDEPKIDIMQEEVHAPAPARGQKRRAPPPQQ